MSSTISLSDSELRTAVAATVGALRRLSEYELEPAICRRMQDLGEQKESLTPDERAELEALVDFSQQRSIDKLEAQVALNRLRAVLPDLVEKS